MPAIQAIPYIKQPNNTSCGPAVLYMVFSFFRKKTDFAKLCEELNPHKRAGIPNKSLADPIRKRGLFVQVRENSTLLDIKEHLRMNRPVIVSYIENVYEEGHYAIASKIGRKYIHLLDPLHGKRFRLPHSEFERRWQSEYGGHKKWLLAVSNKPFSF